ncbi:hypothetical protein C1H76_7751 [Elsinoe australis]|uniref:Uncharacterized protein n=1 Tax=Elsinoe australis TaxID=40998 RepID=A0A4U7AQ41_9PEZI|nr:hypothetical protein C1H76_7751 [Elsinoe australis]
MADSASVSSASTRLTSTTTIMSTLFLTQTVTIPNPTGTASLSTTLVPTSTDTIELKPSQTYLPPAYHLDPNTKEAIAPGPISHKAAIAGGVTGSISAVAAIGIVAFFFWKRRRTRESKEPNQSHTGTFLSFHSNRGDRGEVGERKGIHAQEVHRQEGAPQLRPIVISHTPIIEDNLIRMSLAHWDRPFAYEDQDPFRDPEKQTGDLRVTNPDILSRATTPLASAPSSVPEHPGTFLSRQRTALAAAFAGFRSPSQQSLPVHTTSDTPSPLLYEPLPRPPPAAVAASSLLRPKASTSSDMLQPRRLSDPFLDPQDRPPWRPPPPSQIRHVQSRTPSYTDRPNTVVSSHAVENKSAASSMSSRDRREDRTSRVTELSEPFEFDPRGDGYSPPTASQNWIRHVQHDGSDCSACNIGHG